MRSNHFAEGTGGRQQGATILVTPFPHLIHGLLTTIPQASKIMNTMSTAAARKIHAEFLRYLSRHPHEQVAAIVRCQKLRPDYHDAIQQADLQVLRSLRLIRAYAVQGRAEAIMALASHPWVLHIEPDQPVHTTKQSS